MTWIILTNKYHLKKRSKLEVEISTDKTLTERKVKVGKRLCLTFHPNSGLFIVKRTFLTASKRKEKSLREKLFIKTGIGKSSDKYQECIIVQT